MVAWDSRGQLILVGGTALAVVLVGLALVLNTAIFSANLAARGDGAASDPVRVRGEADVTARTAITDINAENAGNRTFPTLENELEDRMSRWQATLRDQHAMAGQWVHVDRAGVTRGWRIMQTNHDRNFTAGDARDGQHTWLVAENVQEVGLFEQNISRQSTYAAGYGTTKAALANSSYHIAIKEQGTSDFWRIYIFQGVGSQNVYLLTEEPGENFVGSTSAHINFATGSCSYQTLEWVELEVRGGTFGGAPCDELQFFQDLDPGYDIYYNNTAADDPNTLESDNVNRSKGSYELFVGQADVEGEPYHTAASGDSPFRLTALYSAAYDVSYKGERVSYDGTYEAVPDRLGTGSNSVPEVSFTYTYDGDEFDVDWSVSDADGDLDEVEVLLYSNSTDAELRSKTIDVSDSTASGVTTLDPSALNVDSSYDIYVVVSDDQGASASEKKTHDT
jgi:hypothetical protein